MTIIEEQFGRLGNRLFQLAFCFAYAKAHHMDHFYQNTRFFAKYAAEFNALFQPKIVPNDRVSIHIRRGDVNHAIYADLAKTDYYQRAIANFGHGDVFVVFSDDLSWAKQFLELWQPSGAFEFAQGTPEEDLLRMAGCKHNIIANSTFSWWAAYLNPNPEKIVICPRLWYAPGVKAKHANYPEGWIEI